MRCKSTFCATHKQGIFANDLNYLVEKLPNVIFAVL